MKKYLILLGLCVLALAATGTHDNLYIRSTSPFVAFGDTSAGDDGWRITVDNDVMTIGQQVNDATTVTTRLIINAEGLDAAFASGTFAGADTSPSVTAGNVFVFPSGGAAAWTIVDLDSGTAGQIVVIQAVGSSIDVADSNNLKLSADWTPNANDTLTVLTPNGTTWYELDRSAN